MIRAIFQISSKSTLTQVIFQTTFAIKFNFPNLYIKVRVCGIPEAHQNQSIMPKAHYYLVGQEVIYNCSDDAHILIGDPIRICQHNGLWSGKTPLCIQGIYLSFFF